VFQTGTLLQIQVQLANPAPSPLTLAFQIFNVAVPQGSWFSSLAVNGNVDINDVSGSVNVIVNNADLIGVGLAAEITGGATGTFLAITNTVTQVKLGPGKGTFKGFNGTNGAAQPPLAERQRSPMRAHIRPSK
jgi:hypothetical protein